MFYKTYAKRPLGFLLALAAGVIAFPFALPIAVWIKLDSKGPVLFKQKRLGLHGREFTMYKFRSMQVGAETQGSGVYCYKGDLRVTRVGRILRKTSLDEIPQLINILKGDMGFVGMRPPLTYHPCRIDEYTEEQKKVFNLRPGITGWAQINGRNAVEWDERIRLNLWYQEHVTFLLDVKIILHTVLDVLQKRDVLVEKDTLGSFNAKTRATEEK